MPFNTFKIFKYLLLFGLLFCFYIAGAQEKYDVITFRIDSLANIGLPKSALKEVDRLDELAQKNSNAPQQIRAVIYRMTFQSYIEEDAIAAIISRLRMDINRANYPVKPVLQSLLGQMYWNYYQQNRYQFSQRTRLEKPDTDFTKWDLQTIITQTSHLYDVSLTDAAKEQKTPISILDGVLEGDSTTRYLRPTLYDLLVQRAFDFFLTDEAGLNKPKLPFSLNDARFFSDSRTFAGLIVKTTDTASTEYKGIKYLQQATVFHLEHRDDEALADLDMQRLKFLNTRSNVEQKDSLYLAALNQVAVRFSAKPISSQAIVLEGQYYQGIDSLAIAHDLFKQAAAAYHESLGGKNGAALMKQVEQKALFAKVENINIPGRPILGLLGYSNLTKAKITIYRLTLKQMKNYNSNFGVAYSRVDQYKPRLDFLKTLNTVQTKEIKWSDLHDYRSHQLEYRIDELPPGNYILKVSDTTDADSSLISLADFKVTSLAYIIRLNPNRQIEVRVMDRETGKPMNGVKINMTSSSYHYNNTTKKAENTITTDNGISDNNGLFYSSNFVSNTRITVDLLVKGDTLNNEARSVYGAEDNQDDDQQEYKTILFSDRQIYRPGQTIYFKGLQLEVFKGKSKIMAGKKEPVQFLDVNDKEVARLDLKTNDFGTFSGSFIIPQTMLDGNVTLKTEDGNLSVKVEEYKRPTFQVAFLPVKESYKLNDSVVVKGLVTAFSGYGLSQAKVAYHVTCTQKQEYHFNRFRRVTYRSEYNNDVETEIKTDTTITDDRGNYKIKFRAVQGNLKNGKNTNYIYTINATVTDESSETHSGETSVTVGNNDIVLETEVPEQAFTKDSISIPVKINNLNGQGQNGRIKVEVYSLEDAGTVFKTRLWDKPDQHIIYPADFKTDFPDYAFRNEDNVNTWLRVNKIIDLAINADTTKPATINLERLMKQQPGMYQVMISARNEKGDTLSIIKYINLIGEQAKPAKFDDWVIPVLNTVKPGGTASFLVGIDQPINVLKEVYHGPKLISSIWLHIEKGQQNIKIPVSDTDKNAVVQFMMVFQNREYFSYQRISSINPDKSLDIKFLTFNNKLQPGQKEEWKIQVRDPSGEKKTSEMLANLYDASLDDLTPPENWKGLLDPEEQNQPNYFTWYSESFVRAANTLPIIYQYQSLKFLNTDYEKLNLFGYNYYGGYNRNFNYRNNQLQVADPGQKNLKGYRSATFIKDGYDISGKVVGADDGLAIVGLSVRVKGTAIGAVSDVAGYFKLRVPINATLIFSYIGYETKVINTLKADNIYVKMTPASSTLHEVVVAGYSTQKAKGIPATVSIRGIASPSAMNALEGKVSGVQFNMYDKLYDSNLRSEVQILNNHGDEASLRKITLRTNFAETAFFYPQLHTDVKGEILIDFTIPEALTRWKFRALAHTKDLETGYIENTVITQKQLSISANTPRFLREGDTITISARLANLTAGKLKGKVQMQLFNALNMQPVSLFVNKTDEEQSFEVAANINKAVSFKLVVPAGLDALDYKLTADAGAFSDGEENTLPVLPNRMLVTESMPMMVRPGQTKDFIFDKLVNENSATLKNKSLTLEYTANPAWYAVQALPYMMEFPYECSEQVFSRYYANSLATNLVNKMPAIKQVFDQWKNSNSPELLSNLENNPELKSTLLEETPWLRDAENESEQKKRIALLFDLNKMSDDLKLNLDKLQKRQLPDGSFTWFGGDTGDRYITQHIAEGMGDLYHLGIGNDDTELKSIADNTLNYLDGRLKADEKQRKKNKDGNWYYGDLEIHAWFTRSYFLNKPLDKDLKTGLANYLKWAADEWKLRNVYEQGIIALTMQRYKKQDISTQIEHSLLETAQQSDELGMYWAKNRQGYFWYESPVETQSLLIELFTETGNDAKAVDEMKVWLLRNKQTNNWKTTKATAAACYALLLKSSNLLADTGRSIIKLGSRPLEELKPDVKADAGTGYIKTSWADEQIKPALGNVQITNNSTNISWGALHWQYLENLDKITSSETNIKLERKYFIQKQTDAGPLLTAVDASHQPKTGDLLKVVVYLNADRDFEYVQLKDMRPAGTEPVEALSAYKYQGGLYYYQVTKDVATNFFISELNKGNYVFEYQLRVAQPGNFSTGITSIQCMYAPEFNAHSQGARMVIKP